MSEHHGPEGDVLTLLDRAAADTPPLHLAREDVVARGEQIVRRRRARGAGMAIGGLALAGAVWLGAGAGGGGLLGTQDVSPAGVTWRVEEPTTVTVVDGVSRGGGVAPLTVTKGPEGSTATFTVDGRQETVEGRVMPGGADLFVGERATVVVWAAGDDASVEVRPWPAPRGFQAGLAQEDEDLAYLATDDSGYVPSDLVLHSGERVWAMGGEVAETVGLTDSRAGATVFALPGLGLTGYLQDGALTVVEPGSLHVSGGTEPWWRGGDGYTEHLARLPDEAVYARVSWSVPSGRTVPGGGLPVVRAGDAAFAVLSFTEDEVPVAGDPTLLHEWSTDGRTWRSLESGAAVDGTAGPGGSVVLLDETYEVATDGHGWPMLLAEDGSTFLTVSDADGPPTGDGGGVVMWREHWWPWSDRHEVHFAVDGVPVLGPEKRAQDAATISGPAGVVGLVSVPAGS